METDIDSNNSSSTATIRRADAMETDLDAVDAASNGSSAGGSTLTPMSRRNTDLSVAGSKKVGFFR